MLIGNYNHALDAKFRVILPMKLREMPGQDGLYSTFVMTVGSDNSLSAYTVDAWKSLAQALIAEAALAPPDRRRFLRHFLAEASEVTCDQQGRIVVPENLRGFAGLTKDVTWLGVGDHIELWDTAKWRAYQAESRPGFQQQFDKAAEVMSQRAVSELNLPKATA